MKVVFSNRARKEFRRLPVYLQEGINKKLLNLAKNPNAQGLDIKPYHGPLENALRLRVGPARVVYQLRGDEIRVHSVGFRGGVYK